MTKFSFDIEGMGFASAEMILNALTKAAAQVMDSSDRKQVDLAMRLARTAALVEQAKENLQFLEALANDPRGREVSRFLSNVTDLAALSLHEELRAKRAGGCDDPNCACHDEDEFDADFVEPAPGEIERQVRRAAAPKAQTLNEMFGLSEAGIPVTPSKTDPSIEEALKEMPPEMAAMVRAAIASGAQVHVKRL